MVLLFYLISSNGEHVVNELEGFFLSATSGIPIFYRRCNVDKEGIDASLGLKFSLELFKRYRQNGMLHAELPRAPGIRGRCTAFIHLVKGEVASAYLEDQQGKRYPSDKDALCRLDREKGPFEWILDHQSMIPVQHQLTRRPQHHSSGPLAPSMQCSSVPRIISALSWERLSAQAPEQREALYTLLTAINGERTIANIKEIVPFSRDLVDDLLRMLLELEVIVIATEPTGGP